MKRQRLNYTNLNHATRDVTRAISTAIFHPGWRGELRLHGAVISRQIKGESPAIIYLWHFSPPFHQRTARPLRGLDVSSFVKLKLSEIQWDGMLKWHQSFRKLPQRGFWHMAVGYIQNPHSKHPPEITPIVKSVKRAECYIKKKYELPYVTWWQSPHRKLGSKSKEKHIKSLQTLHCWARRRKAPEEPECQVTPKRAWYYLFFRLPHPLYFLMSWFHLYLELTEDRQLWLDTENSR